jgi:hypothetical protein
MARKFSITSANTNAQLVNSLFPAGLKFENFAVDNAWTQELIQQIEARMGVDGYISFGYTPSPKPISFQFQPNSPTVDRLDYLVQIQDLMQEAIVSQLVINLKSIKKIVTLTNGACVTNKLLPNGAKVLEPMQYDFIFESVNVAPMA